jgi:alpha-L-rhamnosidase
VFTHNPWLDKKPGMTLDGVGLYYQRDQTWFKQSKAWIEYITRCQALLQMGEPVVDIAVFTGEEVPRRSVLPDRLINTLPGIFGKEKVEAEKKRLENKGQPLRQIPDGVNHSANMADPEDWIDPLNGYTYDSFNPDALMMMQVKNGRVVLPGGASYGVLVIPGKMLMNPNPTMSAAVQKKLQQLAAAGAKMVVDQQWIKLFGKNKNVVPAPYMESSFEKLGAKRDVEVIRGRNEIAWTHRKTGDADVYFISNQSDSSMRTEFILRTQFSEVEALNPVTGKFFKTFIYTNTSRGLNIRATLEQGESVFFICKKKASEQSLSYSRIKKYYSFDYNNGWRLKFDTAAGGPKTAVYFPKLTSWSEGDSSIRYYSGSVVYSKVVEITSLNGFPPREVSLKLSSVYNIATVIVNGIDCGTVWVQPYSVDISKAIKEGANIIEIIVSNTWHNRLIGDQLLPESKRITWTTAPFRLKDKQLLPAGIVDEVKLTVGY